MDENNKETASAPPPQDAVTPPSIPPTAQPISKTKDEKLWAMLCHLGALGGGMIGIPLGNILVPLIIWLIKKDEYELEADQGKEAVNFQLSILLYTVASLPLCFVFVGFILIPAVIIFSLVFTIIAAVKANDGERYRYPLCIRFVS